MNAGPLHGTVAVEGGHDVWPFLLPAGTTVDDTHIAVSSSGVRMHYKDGAVRLCATSGLWNAPLGFGNAAITDSIMRALSEAPYLSLFRSVHQPAENAASALLDFAGRSRYRRVIFSTSGGASNDAVMKLVRQFWHTGGSPERQLVVGLQGSYHGTMYGSQSLSGDDLLQPVYSMDRRSIRHVAHDDAGAQLEALMRREGKRTAALVVEPVLGSGAQALSPEFLAKVQELREEFGFLLVADEVATGFWRTGPKFASHAWEHSPDILITSKALTNGTLPAAAILVADRIARRLEGPQATFVHGETQAGTPVTCAAIIATLEEMERLRVPDLVGHLGGRLRALGGRLELNPYVATTSGAEAFMGIHLRDADGAPLTGAEVMSVVAAIFEQGVIVHPGPSCIQLLPAYVYEDADVLALEAGVSKGIDSHFARRQQS